MEEISKYTDLIQLLVIITGILIFWYKTQATNELNDHSQGKEIERLKTDCDDCRHNVNHKFEKVDQRIDKLEEKQSKDVQQIYKKLDEVEQRLLQKIETLSQTSNTAIIKAITDLLNKNK